MFVSGDAQCVLAALRWVRGFLTGQDSSAGLEEFTLGEKSYPWGSLHVLWSSFRGLCRVLWLFSQKDQHRDLGLNDITLELIGREVLIISP